MQDAETVLAVLRERGRKGLPCDELYRQMFNRELYLMAFFRINFFRFISLHDLAGRECWRSPGIAR
jgi:hypothetical protein